MAEEISHQPIDWACPHFGCTRQPGEPCNWDEWNLFTQHPEFHAERIAIANSINTDDGYTPDVKDFEKAVIDSGLIV